MSETLSRRAPRSSPYTGTTLPQGQPFWIVDGRAYDFTEWMTIHPGGSMDGLDADGAKWTYDPRTKRYSNLASGRTCAEANLRHVCAQ